jgi:hypothetical protein
MHGSVEDELSILVERLERAVRKVNHPAHRRLPRWDITRLLSCHSPECTSAGRRAGGEASLCAIRAKTRQPTIAKQLEPRPPFGLDNPY